MSSFQIGITPKRRAAGRFIAHVRRSLQKALAEEEASTGMSQSDVARAIDVHRSVISRELRGHKDLTLGRVAELAWALGRKPSFVLDAVAAVPGSNLPPPISGAFVAKTFTTQATKQVTLDRIAEVEPA